MNQVIRLSLALREVYDRFPMRHVMQASLGIVGTMGNVLSVSALFFFLLLFSWSLIIKSNLLDIYLKGLSLFLNGRQPYLEQDFKKAIELPYYYDTDLENFWYQDRNFFGDDGTETSQEGINKNKNIQRQKFQVINTHQCLLNFFFNECCARQLH
jgi:hypothetical protein